MLKLGKPRSSKGMATFVARIADEKIASNILILDLKANEFRPSDYFVICSADSDVQVRAICDEILIYCRNLKLTKPKIEGSESARWVIMDFFDVVVHIMQKNARDFYQLERLWGDSEFFELNSDGKPVQIKNYKPQYNTIENIDEWQDDN